MIEDAMLYVIGIADVVKRGFIKLFPTVGTIIGVLYAYGLVGAMERGHIYSEQVPYIFASAAVFTVLVLLWIALSYKEKLARKRGYYERSKK